MTMTTQTSIAAATERLDQATIELTPCAPVRDLIGASDQDAAYAVQMQLTSRRVSRGAHVVGRKIGLTSEAVQAQLGVDQPDFGVLFADMQFSNGDTVPTELLMQPKIEAEIAFVLAADLDGDLTGREAPQRVRDAVDHAVAALEIVDSRIAGWDITITDTVADNGSSGLFVLGNTKRTLDDVEPRNVAMSMSVNGETVSEGTGAACLGDPLNALLWLARAAQHYGEPLRAGQVILSGALGPMAPISGGDIVVADIAGLGTVSIALSSKDEE